MRKIYVAGHKGLVGSAIVRKLKLKGYNNIIVRDHEDLDLSDQAQVNYFFEKERPEYVFLAAAKVGGILANSTYPADFIYQNLIIGTNIVHAGYKYGIKKLINLGSSCIYPRLSSQPMKEEALLSGYLEPTNEAYAVAKIAIIKLCHYYNEQYKTNFISLMPTNQYGPNDNFNMKTAHLLPMLVRRFHLAKLLNQENFDVIRSDLAKHTFGYAMPEECDNEVLEKLLNSVGAYKDHVEVWGDGSVYRELMHSDDLADACVYIMEKYDAKDIGELVNITSGEDIQLCELYEIIKEVVGFPGEIKYDRTKPNGMPRKLMDATKIRSLGWHPKILLYDGIKIFYESYVNE
ncbi:MAG: GDP-L-fucose synthase [Alphaproteobacteria bacterium]|nr:GDP-L-fucose synthase [Alphaproteobacteria bacterium]